MREGIMSQEELKDIEAIKQLKARYALGADAMCTKHELEPFLCCFTEDVVWDAGEGFGRYEGKDALREYWEENAKNSTFSVHFFTNPIIEVNDSKATGRWYLLTMLTQKDGTALWIAGIEDEKYEKVNGQWLISEMVLTPFLVAPFGQGWKGKKGYG